MPSGIPPNIKEFTWTEAVQGINCKAASSNQLNLENYQAFISCHMYILQINFIGKFKGY